MDDDIRFVDVCVFIRITVFFGALFAILVLFVLSVTTAGISLLGRNSGIEGLYKLGVDSIRAVNKEDAIFPGEKLLLSLCHRVN